MEIIKVFNPYNEHCLGELMLLNEQQIEQLLQQAHQTYLDRDHWLTASQRIAILEKFALLLQQHHDTLAVEAAAEGGKPLPDSLVEVTRAINGVKVAVAQLQQMHGREIPMGLTPSSEHRIAYTYREPCGVVLGISAFNHPVNLIIHQIVPAIACGCPVLIKPATSTPLSCIKLVNLLYEAGLPKQWCQVILCQHQYLSKIISDSRVSFLSFIGSSKVGWELRSKLAPGTHCALEHGGVAPVIVAADAKIEPLIPAITKGGFYHAGQVCVSVKRVFIHESIMTPLASLLTKAAEQLKIGDPTDPTTEVGPLITKAELQRVDSWVQEAIAAGAQLLCGGRVLPGNCYAPTILLDPPNDAKVSQLETFGPVICLYRYRDRLDAIAKANQLPYCFQAAVFTQDIDIALDTVKRLKATTVMVNDHTAFRVDWMPFGGREQSGLGMGGIINSMHDMSCEKMMVIRSPLL